LEAALAQIRFFPPGAFDIRPRRHYILLVAVQWVKRLVFFREDAMAIKKEFLKKKSVCKTTFSLDKATAGEASSAALVGDFNAWDVSATPMKRLKGGEFKVTVPLPTGQDYQYRFLLDGVRWVNDPGADGYVPGPFGEANCVVAV